ncbi:MAG: PDZ domain-containing protein [Rhodoferax sp.]
MKISRKYLKGPHAAAIVVTLFGATALAQTGVPKREPAARAVAPAPVGAESLASKARDYLAEGDLVKALASAQQASRTDPANYKGHYYEAYALMMLGEFDSAGQALQRSLQAARSAEQKSAVTALGLAIAAGAKLREASKAAEEGLLAKAARLYKEAFEGGYPSAEPALKAAQLYERTQDLITAVSLLKAVQEKYPGQSASASAASELVRLKTQLSSAATAKLREAVELAPGTRQSVLDAALKLDPLNESVVIAAANESMRSADWSDIEPRLKALLRLQILDKALGDGRLRLLGWNLDPRAKALLEDAWGPQLAGPMLSRHFRSVIKVQLNPNASLNKVDPGGPGDKVGLKVGDVLVQVGGVPVKDSKEAIRQLARLPSGLIAAVVAQRGGTLLKLYPVPDATAPVQGDCAAIVNDSGSYKGGCKDGLAHGLGELRWRNSSGNDVVYVGSFDDGMMAGRGVSTIFFPTGSRALEMLDGQSVREIPVQ